MKYLTWLIACLSVNAVPAQTPVAIKSAVEHEVQSLEQLYKGLHASPELSFQEKNTSALLAAELKRLGMEVSEGIGGHGVVGVLKNGKGPVLLVRADMDALPIKEATGVPFASIATAKDSAGAELPVMHACGHDLHMTVWTGVARVLTQVKRQWNGTLVFVAQPAEERGAGALSMIRDGLYTRFPRPDYALALHVNAKLPAGTVGYCPGAALANIDMVDVTVKGKGGHGGMPNYTIDPIVLAAKTVMSLQTIVSREIDPLEAAVVTVGSFHGGSKGNIIPGEVKMELTVRSLSDQVQKVLIEKIRRTCIGEAMAAGLQEKDYPIVTVRDEYTPSLYNDPELTQAVAQHFIKIFGNDKVTRLTPEMFGEDFGQYGRQSPRIPIVMYSLGTVSEAAIRERQGGATLPSTHSAYYLPDLSKSLRMGVESMSQAILFLLKK